MKKGKAFRKIQILPMILALFLTTGQSFISSLSAEAENENSGSSETTGGGESNTQSTGGFTVTGGTYGVDYVYGPVTVQLQGYSNMEGTYPTSTVGAALNNCHTYPLTIDQITPFKSGTPFGITYNALVINTNAKLEITTQGQKTSDCIYINPGVQANLIFNNVNIDGDIPVNIATNKSEGDHASDPDQTKTGDITTVIKEGDPYKNIKDNNPTSLNLTLAKGSVNQLKAWRDTSNYTYQFPAIRCGEGSKLTIDDDRLNIDTDGNAVLPELGRISRDATLKDGTVVKKGDRLTKLDSDNPGTLTAYGGFHSAAIGGSAMENSGDITINGGNIITKPYRIQGNDDAGAYVNYYSSGAGIGGGHGGGGTSITINGGNIDADGTCHGAGIGAGSTYIWGFGSYGGGNVISYALTDSIIDCYLLSPIAGDITINGGYIKSTGHTHGNAFGQGCGCSNTGRSIIVTGGTLLPSSYAGEYDIGGTGGDVYVLGGSVRTSAGKYQSKSNDGSAWGDMDKNTRVYMCTIDLSGYASAGITVNEAQVESINMSIQGKTKNYGLPSYTDEHGKLYFWLPKDTAGQEIRVKLAANQPVKDEHGITSYQPIDNFDEFTIENVTADGKSILKQWSHFDTDVSKDDLTSHVSEENKKLLTRKYNGKSLLTDRQSSTLLQDIFKDPGVPVSNPSNRKLTYDQSYFEPVTAEKVDNNGKSIENTEIKSADQQAGVGKYRLLISSKQYGTTSPFNSSFWGHRGYVNAEITPADSTTTTTYTRANNEESDQEITFTTKVRPADNEANTCESPRGTVNYYLIEKDPQTSEDKKIKIAENVELNQVTDTNNKLDGFNYSTATYTWKPSDTNFTRDPNKTYKIQAEYVPGSDPNDASNAINYKSSSVTVVPDIKIEPVDQNFVVDEKISGNTERIINAQDDKADRSFTFGDHSEDGKNSTLTLIPSNTNEETTLPNSGNQFTFSSNNTDVATIDNDGLVTFNKAGTVTFTITQSGNGAYNDKSKQVTYTVGNRALNGTDYKNLKLTKSAERLSGSGSLKIGDRIAYTITLNNPVPGTSGPVYINDQLPGGLGMTESAIQITHPDKSIENKAISDVYDPATRTISLKLDNVAYGETYTIRIETVIEQTTYHDANGNVQTYDYANTAYAGPEQTMSEYPLKAGPVRPGESVNSNGDPLGPIVLEKGCEEDEDDGYLLYTMRVWNWDTVPWENVSFRDVLPEEITLVDNSLTVEEPGQKEKPLDQSRYYNPATRTIDYPIGVLHPNETYIIRFKCNVATEETEEKNETKEDIENIGSLVTGNGGVMNTPGVHIGETKSISGSPSGMSLSKDSHYREQTPDEIVYTLQLKNNSGENTENAKITDTLPAPLVLKSNSVSVRKPDGTVESLKDSDVYDASGRTISYLIPAGVKPGETNTLTFTALITGDNSLKTKAEVETRLAEMKIDGVTRISDLQNTGHAEGIWSGNGTSGWSISTGGVSAGGGNSGGNNNSGNNGSQGSNTVTGHPGMYITKKAENHSHGTDSLHVGDVISYRIEAGNNGTMVNQNTVITDYLPVGLDVNSDSLKLIIPDAGVNGEKEISPLVRTDSGTGETGTYTVNPGTVNRDGNDVAVNIMKVSAGDLRPGEKAYLYFDATVTDQVTDIGNSAGLGDDAPIAPVYPGNPDQKTPEPEEDTPVLQKNAVVRRQAIEYAVHIKNPTRRSTWRNVQLFDYLPPQLEIVDGSIRIQRYENGALKKEFVPPASTYNETTHILSYPISRLRPGEEYVLNYQAVARGSGNKVQPVENHAGYTGEDDNGKKYSGSVTNAVPDIPSMIDGGIQKKPDSSGNKPLSRNIGNDRTIRRLPKNHDNSGRSAADTRDDTGILKWSGLLLASVICIMMLIRSRKR